MNIPSISSLWVRLKAIRAKRLSDRDRRDAFMQFVWKSPSIHQDAGFDTADVYRAARLPIRVDAARALRDETFGRGDEPRVAHHCQRKSDRHVDWNRPSCAAAGGPVASGNCAQAELRFSPFPFLGMPQRQA